MAKRRPSGDGMVRKRDDGRWEGRIVIGHKASGDSIFRNIYAHSKEECKRLLAEMITEMKAEIAAEKERIKAAPKAS